MDLNKRIPPLGIKIACWFGVFTALVGLIGIIIFFAGGNLIWGLLTLLVVGIEIIVTYGLWTLKPWAWLGALIWYGLGLLSSFYQLVSGDVSNLIGIIVSTFLIFLVSVHRDVYVHRDEYTYQNESD